MKKFCLLFFVWLCLAACREKELTGGQIVDKAIEQAGGERYENAEITFRFRGKKYKSTRKDGLFRMERIFRDSTGSIRDVWNNDGFSRFRNDTLQTLPDSLKTRYRNSVNSVHYFMQLPYGLNDPAVHKTLLGTDTIAGKTYYEVRVTFDPQAGGHQDTYLYWISKTDFSVDYLAYQYAVDGGGIRFREAYHPRRIGGIRFVNYRNFKPANLSVDLAGLDSLFTAGKLERVSVIENEAIEVTRMGR